jgi:hypothetical protein
LCVLKLFVARSFCGTPSWAAVSVGSTSWESGAKTFKQVAAENGADWRDQIDDIAEVLRYAQEEYGLDLSSMIFGQQCGEPAPVTGGR